MRLALSLGLSLPDELLCDMSVVSVRTIVLPGTTVALCEACGEVDSSESRQYTTPVWFTCILGVHPIAITRSQPAVPDIQLDLPRERVRDWC